MTGPRGTRRALGILKLGLLLAVLTFVGRELLLRLSALPQPHPPIDALALIAAGICTTLACVLYVIVFARLQDTVGAATRRLAPVLVALVTPVGKYLPGKVGGILGAIWVYQRFGVGAGTATAITLLAGTANFAAVSILLLPFIIAGTFRQFASPWLVALFPAVWAFGLVLAFPRAWVILINRVGGRTRHLPAIRLPHTAPYLAAVFWSLLQLVLVGSAFWCVARAVGPVAITDWYLFTVALMAAGTVGFFALFAPAGIGVREGLLLLILDGIIGDSQLALAVIILRVNQVAIELVLALIGLLLWTRDQKTHNDRAGRTPPGPTAGA